MNHLFKFGGCHHPLVDPYQSHSWDKYIYKSKNQKYTGRYSSTDEKYNTDEYLKNKKQNIGRGSTRGPDGNQHHQDDTIFEPRPSKRDGGWQCSSVI
jgi:hypothetical protein